MMKRIRSVGWSARWATMLATLMIAVAAGGLSSCRNDPCRTSLSEVLLAAVSGEAWWSSATVYCLHLNTTMSGTLTFRNDSSEDLTFDPETMLDVWFVDAKAEYLYDAVVTITQPLSPTLVAPTETIEMTFTANHGPSRDNRSAGLALRPYALPLGTLFPANEATLVSYELNRAYGRNN